MMTSPKCILGSTIAFVIVAAAAVGIYYAACIGELSESEAIPSPSPVFLSSTSDGHIMLIDLIAKEYLILVEEHSTIVCFEYYQKNRVLFYGIAKPGEPIKVSGNGSHPLMNYSAPWTKTAMAIDDNTEQLYVLDGSAEKLYAINMRNDSYSVYLENLEKPKDVIVDSSMHMMYILQETSTLMVHMIEGQVNKLKGNVHALAIDREDGVFYFADGEHLRRMDLEDKANDAVYDTGYISSMTVFYGHLLYISETKNGTGNSLNQCSEGCRIIEEVSIDDDLVSMLTHIKAYDFIEHDFD